MPYYQSLYDILGISKSASADEGKFLYVSLMFVIKFT